MLCNSLERVQERAGCRILPKNNNYAAVTQLLGDRRIHFAKDDGYCVYAFEDDQGSLFVPALEDLDYSIDFMPNP